MAEVAKAIVPLVLYTVTYQQFSLFVLPDTVLVAVVGFVLYDFFYYWNHRLGHEINLLWAAHVVHHSSEEYNLTTALRQTSTGVLSFVFYIPLAILGIEPILFISISALNLVYQFWVHTRHIDKLGRADRVFVTPSNHRVHHAQNDIYLDRNYGGVFIIWDRLFGTFQEELDNEPPVYGVRKPLHSWNPLWANFQVYKALLEDCIRTKSWKDKLTLWFKPTGWRPADCVGSDRNRAFSLNNFTKFNVELSLLEKTYAVLQYVMLSSFALFFLLNIEKVSATLQLMIATFVVIMAISLGGILERKLWALVLESAKLVVIAFAVVFYNVVSLEVGTAIMCAVIINMGIIVSLGIQRRSEFLSDVEQVNKTDIY